MLLIASGCAQSPKTTSDITKNNSDYHPVILVSIDGFKPDYLHRNVTPNLNNLVANGVFTEAMRPSFPSITFPNHYTLVTGMRPDHHGIVGNTMEDPKILGVKFSLSNKAAVLDRRWWDEAEPIWVTAEKIMYAQRRCFGLVLKQIFMAFALQSSVHLTANYRQTSGLIRC